jgi:peptide deformylase
MSIIPIVTGKDTPILRTKCQLVAKFDKTLRKLVEDMNDTMVKAKGVGIAAPQVGIDARVFLAVLGADGKNPVTLPMVNPEISWFSDEVLVEEEGCLSLPKVFGKVQRPVEVIVEFQDLKGSSKSLKLKGLDARVVQHELDHLNGVLFIDKMIVD